RQTPVLFVEGAGVLSSPVSTTPPSEAAGQDFAGGRCGQRCTERAPKVAHFLAPTGTRERHCGPLEAIERAVRGSRSLHPRPGPSGSGRTQDSPCPVPVYSAPDAEDVVDTI